MIGLALLMRRNRMKKASKGENTMPNRDATGPQGEGPMTGRGLGNCTMGSRPRLGRLRDGIGRLGMGLRRMYRRGRRGGGRRGGGRGRGRR
jgi:hypothetical protein